MKWDALAAKRMTDGELAHAVDVFDRFLALVDLGPTAADGRYQVRVRWPKDDDDGARREFMQYAAEAAWQGVLAMLHVDALQNGTPTDNVNVQLIASAVVHTKRCTNPENCPAVAHDMFSYMLLKTLEKANAEQRARMSGVYPFHVSLLEIYENWDGGPEYVMQVAQYGPPTS